MKQGGLLRVFLMNAISAESWVKIRFGETLIFDCVQFPVAVIDFYSFDFSAAGHNNLHLNLGAEAGEKQ